MTSRQLLALLQGIVADDARTSPAVVDRAHRQGQGRLVHGERARLASRLPRPPRTSSARSPRSAGASEERRAQRGLLAPAHGARPVARPALARRHAGRPLRRRAPDRRLHGRPQVLERPLPLPGAAPGAVLPVRDLRAEHGLGRGRDRHDRPAALRRDLRLLPGPAVLRADPHRRRLSRAARPPDRPSLRLHARLLRHVASRDRGHRDHALPGRTGGRRSGRRPVAGGRPARDRRPSGADLLPHRQGPRSRDLPPGPRVPARAGDRALGGIRSHAAGHGLDRARVPRRGRGAAGARASRSASSTCTRSSRSTARRSSPRLPRPACS